MGTVPLAMDATESTGERVARRLWLAGLALAPLWFGSNTPGAWALNAIVFPGAALVYETALFVRGAPRPVALGRIAVPLIGFAAVVGWILIQCLPGTPSALWHPIWGMAGEALSVPVRGSISVNADATALALVRLLTCGCAFWLALQIGRDAGQARRVLCVLLAAGTVYAAYGVVSFVIAPDRLLWIRKLHYRDSVTGPFVNRNSFATFAGISLVIAAGLAADVYGRAARGQNVRRTLSALVAVSAGSGGLILLCGFVIAAALFMSTSRGGILCSVIALVALSALLALRGRRVVRPFVAPALVAALAVGAFLVSGGAFRERLESQGLESDGRPAAYRIVIDSIRNAPLTGFGYGTFPDVFPMYRDGGLSAFGTWGKAHNTYLETVQGLGIPMALVLNVAVGIVVVRCFRGALERRRNATAPLVAASASVAVLLHAGVDFSLQIQAIALWWAALLGLGFAQAFSARNEGRPGTMPPVHRDFT